MTVQASLCLIWSQTPEDVFSPDVARMIKKGPIIIKILHCRISVENAYMEEKEDTAAALGEIAISAG